MTQESSTPRDAATIVLLRTPAGGGVPEVLMVRRKKGSSFMADAFVFPGGRIDDHDLAPHPIISAPRKDDAGTISSDPRHATACRVAAIREVFEEAGVLLALDRGGQLVHTDGDRWFESARRAVHEGQRSFSDVLEERSLSLAFDELNYFARWITPASEPRRFDTRFFLAHMPAGQTAAHAPSELTEHRWSTASALITDNIGDGVKLPPPTLWHLSHLARMNTAEEAIAWARQQRVESVRPKLVAIDGTIVILLPWDPDYNAHPGEGVPIQLEASVSRYLLVDGHWQGAIASLRG